MAPPTSLAHLPQVVVGNLDDLLKAGLGRRTRSISLVSSPPAGGSVLQQGGSVGQHAQGLPPLPPLGLARGLARDSTVQPLLSGLAQSHSGSH